MTQFFLDTFNYLLEFFLLIFIGAALIEGLHNIIYLLKD